MPSAMALVARHAWRIVIVQGMSYYSTCMSWDHTRLTSSKVVAHNTCSAGTATDRSVVYRY